MFGYGRSTPIPFSEGPPVRVDTSFFFVCFTRLWAIDSHQSITQMQHTSWSAKEGVIGEVLSIAQTTDGFIWIGTTSGLLRFDGSVFERYQPEIGSFPEPRWVSALLATPDGGLWVGYLSGGASYLNQGKLRNYDETDGLPRARLRNFAQDVDGTIWAATSGGLAHFNGQRWERPKWGVDQKSASSDIKSPSSVSTDSQGLWISDSHDGIYFGLRGSHELQRVTSQPAPGYLPTFSEASEDAIWLWVPELLSLQQFPLQNRAKRASQTVRNSNGMFLVDREGGGWMMTRHDGVLRAPSLGNLRGLISPDNPSIERFGENQGLTNATVYCTMEDREGDIWVGTLGGLDRFRPRNAAWTQLQSVATQRMQLVAGDKGDVWASSPQGLWNARNGMRVRNSPAGIQFSFRDPLGGIFFWAQRGEIGDLWQWRDGKFTRLMPPSRILPRTRDLDTWVPTKAPVRALTRDGSGELWVSVRGQGVLRQHHGVWERMEILTGQRYLTAYSAVADGQGRVFLAFPEQSKIALWDRGTIRIFSPETGLKIGAITQIAYVEGEIWASGEDGLAVFNDGRFWSLTPAVGEKFGLVAGVAGSSESGLWLSTTAEVIHIPQREVSMVIRDPNHRIQYESFDPVSDLAERPSGTSDTPAVVGTDGILWFATPRGVIRVDPARLHRNRIFPQVALRSVTANGKSYSLYSSIILPPRTTNLQIRYSVLSFPVPGRVRSRYRLIGADKEWQDEGSRVDVAYKDLKPGRYTFQVLACNNDGLWSPSAMSLAFSIQPAFYQTGWFQIFYILSGGFLIWVMYRLRLRQVTARVKLRYSERLNERTRIARELHDTLLQSLAGVSLQLDGVAKQAGSRPEKFVSLVNQVREMVDICFVEARAKVWTLRSTSLEGPGLTATLREFCERISPLTTARCEFYLIGDMHPLPSELEEELLRIAQEAVHNAMRHAQAHIIEVVVEYTKKMIAVTVSDDGRGFDISEGLRKSDHWGLKNMRERAEQIHAIYNISSSAGNGTVVKVCIRKPTLLRLPHVR